MNKLLKALAVACVGGLLIAGCNSREAEPVVPEKVESPAPSVAEVPKPVKETPKPTEGKLINVSSDPSATYYLLQKEKQPDGLVTITSKRVGSSGESYSKRLYDCNANEVKYLGTGATKQEMEQSQPDPNMAPIVPGSIADNISRHACGD